MATIKIAELHPVGYELFQDAETFLNELSASEIETVEGGKKIIPTPPDIYTRPICTRPIYTYPIPIDPTIGTVPGY
jgi:hypothetical protein